MDEYRNDVQNNSNPRRKKKSKFQVFKETYLPFVIVCLAIVLIITIIIGGIVRGVQRNRAETQAAQDAALALQAEKEALALEEQERLADAEAFAAGYDYDSAIEVLEDFSGDIEEYPTIAERIEEYELARLQLVAWGDPSQIPCEHPLLRIHRRVILTCSKSGQPHILCGCLDELIAVDRLRPCACV